MSTPEPPPLPSVPSLADNGCKTRLLRHLDQCIAEIETEICPRLDPATSAPNATAKSTISDKAGYVFFKESTEIINTMITKEKKIQT